MIRPHFVPRPPIAVVVPFRGAQAAASRLLDALAGLELVGDDELVVVDNGGEGAFGALELGAARVAVADWERSSYYARNAGAERTSAPWLLFIDADCRPRPSILGAYFEPEPGERCGVVAGAVRPAPGATSLAARYATARGHLDESFHLRASPYPAGITANLLVRREVWEGLGGFHEGVRSGADVEFCWRAQEAGWALAHRPEAVVEHVHPDSLRALLRKSARYGAGRRWVNRRYRGSMPRPRVAREVVRSLAGGIGWPLAGKPTRGAFKLIDGAHVVAGAWGYVAGDSRAPRGAANQPAGRHDLVLSTDAFPARSETFVYNEALALRDLGWSVRVEATARPARVERSVAHELRIDYVEDYAPRDALGDLARLLARHPIRAARDGLARRRWRAGGEGVLPLRAIAAPARRLTDDGTPHTHVHFAAGAALDAMRLGLLLGSTYSVTGHGYDVFQVPRNVPEKLQRASFVVAPCEYTAAHLRELMPPARRGEVHVIVMGIDGERFRRRTQYPGNATVVAVGRLVEKKGFAYLLEAVGELRRLDRLDRLVIAGAGPLREELARLAESEGVADAAALVEAWGADEVREVLEGADLLAYPSVIAADGDRDAMPMVVKEAMAMEVPVVTSDVAGLPELVRPEWGRMVPERDSGALADAIGEVLALPAAERERMGAAGRRFVLGHCALRVEAEKLSSLLERARG
jgi:glycosyltransferase involved in cell wall biosynthesis